VTDVAVVIPNHNGRAFIERCIEAARAGGAADIVVADDASSDDSPTLARAAGARVVAAHGRGFAAAVNTGAAASTAPYLLLLNSDCFVDPGAIKALAAALDEDDAIALCGAHLVNSDGSPAKSGGALVSLASSLAGPVSARSGGLVRGTGVQRVPFVPLACALVRRSDWVSVGGLDERYRFYFEDYDLSWELGVRGRAVAVCWSAQVLHVGGGSSSAHEPQRWFTQYHESRARYLRKRYPVGWLVYAAVWPPLALLHAARWLLRGGAESRRWARAYAAAAVAGLGRP
jgi:GT2 family glycosyltransferase